MNLDPGIFKRREIFSGAPISYEVSKQEGTTKPTRGIALRLRIESLSVRSASAYDDDNAKENRSVYCIDQILSS